MQPGEIQKFSYYEEWVLSISDPNVEIVAFSTFGGGSKNSADTLHMA